VTIDVADLRKRAERTFPQVYPSELTELLDAYEERDRLLAELDDPMLRLIAAAKRAVDSHIDNTGTCGWCDIYAELQSAIDYAEQRRAQG